MKAPDLRLLALEVTRRCSMKCRHCRGDSRDVAYDNELTRGELAALFDNIAGFASPIMILTGGEPLSRDDIFTIAEMSRDRGFKTVLATCGHLLDDVTVPRLIASGISRISVSLDGARAETHDSFRGVPGAYELSLTGLAAARRHDLPFQINSTVTTHNIDELEDMHDRSVELGAEAFHPFLLVPTGRGTAIHATSLTPDAYEAALERIAVLADNSPIEIKPTCSPHYARIIRTRTPGSSDTTPREGNSASVRHGMTKGCLGGQGFAFVSHTGIVQTCGFLDIPAGDLRSNGFDFAEVWETSPLFKNVRTYELYGGKCGRCEFIRVCGGCRARAYHATGDYMAEEPNCAYIPGTAKQQS